MVENVYCTSGVESIHANCVARSETVEKKCPNAHPMLGNPISQPRPEVAFILDQTILNLVFALL